MELFENHTPPRALSEICLIPTAPAAAQAYYLRDGKRRYSLPLRDTYYKRG